jgi:hypothetical protein
MKHRRPEVGDHDNTGFETVDPASHHVKPGFDAGAEVSSAKEGEAKEGEVRFPNRRREEEVPKGSLADRLRDDGKRDA